MLRFLLDEHISPKVAKQLQSKQSKFTAISMPQWQSGKFLSANDEVILIAASTERLTLVTYDMRTIAPLIKSWAEQDRLHAGVVFVDNSSIKPSDTGGLVLALHRLWQDQHNLDWTNRIVYLKLPVPER